MCTKRSELLGALGNSAGPSTLPIIEEALHDSTPAIRAAAARALRLIPGSEVDHLLAAVITSDPDGAVRADAIFATRFRHPLSAPLADALMQVASTGCRQVRPQQCDCSSASKPHSISTDSGNSEENRRS